MNKQKAIEKIEKLEGLTIKDKDSNFDIEMIPKGEILEIVDQLDGPEKPVVPQFVADWYENNKYDFEDNLYRLCTLYTERKLFKELDEWFYNDNNKPIETLVMMHKFGYEIEKEKLYTAKLKLTGEYLVYYASIKDLHHDKTTDNAAKRRKVYHFTEDDLVKYHIWGSNAYEVKEVEE